MKVKVFMSAHTTPCTMCGRFALATGQQRLAIEFDAEPIPDALAPAPTWNAAPTNWMPVILERAPEGASSKAAPRHMRPMQWGLLPHWSKDAKGPHGHRPINARSETVAEKRMFSRLVHTRRCIIPADGWYEWRASPRGKVPHWHHPLDERPLGLAGLWSSWAGTDGSVIESFTILTTESAPHLAPIHARMPVLIAPESRARWLDARADSTAVLAELATVESVHAVAASIEFFPVAPDVNRVDRDGPDLIRPIHDWW